MARHSRDIKFALHLAISEVGWLATSISHRENDGKTVGMVVQFSRSTQWS